MSTHPLLTSSYALGLARKINDANTPAREKIIACVELAQFAELANYIHMRNLAHDLVKTQPLEKEVTHRWVNGARVRIKK